jgi:hypothetical protein
MSIFDGFKFAIVIAVILLVGGGYWHYRSVVADLREAEAANVLLTSQRDAAISTANANAQAAAKADQDRLRVVAELEVAHAEIAAAAARDLETVSLEVGHDISVADLLSRDFYCGSRYRCHHDEWMPVHSEGDRRREGRGAEDRGSELAADVLGRACRGSYVGS